VTEETRSATERITENARATEAVGAALGAVLRRGDVIAIDGDLGAGKTCFVRGLARGCGTDAELVRSPTFVLHHVYPGGRITLHHIDCYRLGDGADLGLFDVDALRDDGAVAIEWAQLANLVEHEPVRVTIDILSGDERAIRLGSGAPPRFADALVRLPT